MNNKLAGRSREVSPDPLSEEEEIYENELARQESRFRNEPPKLGRNFTEAVGKVVAFVNEINDPPNWTHLRCASRMELRSTSSS